MGSCQYEGDVFNYQGAEYDDLGIDEASQFTEYMFNHFKTNLRTTRTDLKLQMYLGTNPGGVGHAWLKRLFIDKEYSKDENPTDYGFVPAKVYDNPIILKADPQYVHELETLPPDLKRAFLEGDWDVFAGQVFSQWRRDKHVVSKLPILEECDKVIGFDWGYNDHGAAVFVARDKNGHVYQYREIYQNRKTPEEWAEDLKIACSLTPVNAIYLPHDCFSKQQGRDSIAEVFKRNGLQNIRRADTLSKNARKNSLALFHMYLSDSSDGIPYFQVHESCTNTIRTLPELVYEEREGKPKEDVDSSCEDHLYDSLRTIFIEWGKPRGHGGPVRPHDPTSENFLPTVIDGRVPAPDIKKLIKGTRKRDWRYT